MRNRRAVANLNRNGRKIITDYPDRHQLHYELMLKIFGAPFHQVHFLLVDTVEEAYEPIARTLTTHSMSPGWMNGEERVPLKPPDSDLSKRARRPIGVIAPDNKRKQRIHRLLGTYSPDVQIEDYTTLAKPPTPQVLIIDNGDGGFSASELQLIALRHPRTWIVIHGRPSLKHSEQLNQALRKAPNLILIHEFPANLKITDSTPAAALLAQPSLIYQLQALSFIVWYNMDALNTQSLLHHLQATKKPPWNGCNELLEAYRNEASWAVRRIRLDFNETRTQRDDSMLEALRSNIVYTNAQAVVLKARVGLAQRFDVGEDQVLLCRGANHGIKRAVVRLLSDGQNAVLPDVTYIGHVKAVLASGAEPQYVRVRRRDDEDPLSLHCFPWELIHAAEQCDADLVCLSNPSNPLGEVIDADTFDRWIVDLRQTAPRAVIMIDACFDRYGRVLGIPMPRYGQLARNHPLVVVGSLSKEDGYAGPRAGYVFGSADIISDIREVLPQQSSISELGALALAASIEPSFEARSYDTMRTLVLENERISEAVCDIAETTGFSIGVRQGMATGFSLVSIRHYSIDWTRAWLRRYHGLEVAPVSRFSLSQSDMFSNPDIEVVGIPEPTLLRISAGTATENDRLLHALRHLATWTREQRSSRWPI